MRKIFEGSNGDFKVVVRGKNDYAEYVTSFYEKGVKHEAATAYDDDKQSAIDTANYFLNHCCKGGK